MPNKETLVALRVLENENRSSLLELIEKNPDINKTQLISLTSRDRVEISIDTQLLTGTGLITNHGFGDTAIFKITLKGERILKALREKNFNYLEV